MNRITRIPILCMLLPVATSTALAQIAIPAPGGGAVPYSYQAPVLEYRPPRLQYDPPRIRQPIAPADCADGGQQNENVSRRTTRRCVEAAPRQPVD